MPYQSGRIGPLYIDQNNSGTSRDIRTPVDYRPGEFGAPHGALIQPGSFHQDITAHGDAHVDNLHVNDTVISFEVSTVAAGGFPIGHHSSRLEVWTSFTWYLED
jgi:hypothetical protein